MDADEARSMGQRLLQLRAWRGMTQKAVAELAGISESYLSRIERGERPIDRRSRVEALATALRVAPSEITGQPYPPSNESEIVAHAAAQALRAVLRDIEVGVPPTEVAPRPLAALHSEVAVVNEACGACDYALLGHIVPDLIGDL